VAYQGSNPQEPILGGALQVFDFVQTHACAVASLLGTRAISIFPIAPRPVRDLGGVRPGSLFPGGSAGNLLMNIEVTFMANVF
jgi:hypothetical protein